MPQDYTPFEHPEDVATIFTEAWNRRDPDRLAALFEEDADFVNVVGIWWREREAIRQAHAYGLAQIFGQSTLRATKVSTKRLSPDIALVHARLRLSGQSATGEVSQPGVRRTILSFVLRRTDQGWRCAAAQNTDIIPGAETHIATPDGHLHPADYR